MHENEVRNKRVESVWFPCLDVGSTPTSSTRHVKKTLRKTVLFFRGWAEIGLSSFYYMIIGNLLNWWIE